MKGRASANMLDLTFIRNHPDKIKEACRLKNNSLDVDYLLELDRQVLALQRQVEDTRAEQKQLSKRIQSAGKEKERSHKRSERDRGKDRKRSRSRRRGSSRERRKRSRSRSKDRERSRRDRSKDARRRSRSPRPSSGRRERSPRRRERSPPRSAFVMTMLALATGETKLHGIPLNPCSHSLTSFL